MLRKHQPAKIIVAVPVLPYDTLAVFEKILMNFVFNSLKDFRGVGRFRRLSTGRRRRSNPDVENYASACVNNIHNTNQLFKKQKLWNN
jgi:predicted phosphoribosyltransferase